MFSENAFLILFSTPGIVSLVDGCWKRYSKCLWMACHVIPNYTIASCRPLELEPSPRRRSGRCQVWFTCAEEFHPRKGDWMEHDPVHTTEILACPSRLCSPASWVTLMLQRLLFLNIKFSPLACWNFDDKMWQGNIFILVSTWTWTWISLVFAAFLVCV